MMFKLDMMMKIINDISITIVVTESNIIGEVVYKGNRKIKDSKFKEELEISLVGKE